MLNTPLIVAFLVLTSCGADTENANETLSQSVECAKTESDFIRLKLAPNCAGCHGEGTSAPYFASAESFEGLIVQNPRFVVPGDPDNSEFVRLLEGNGTGAFTQMPLRPIACRPTRHFGPRGAPMDHRAERRFA